MVGIWKLSILTFQHFEFYILCITCFIKIPPRCNFNFPLSPAPPNHGLLRLALELPTFCFTYAQLPFWEKTATAVWGLIKISWTSKLLVLEEEGLHFLWCIFKGHVNVKRRNSLWSLVSVIIFLVHLSLPNFTENTLKRGALSLLLIFSNLNWAFISLCGWAGHCVTVGQKEDEGWLLM